jgi:glucosylceramidase
MKKTNTIIILVSLVLIIFSCNATMDNLDLKVIETSANGNKMTSLTTFNTGKEAIQLDIIPEQKFQKITGFGGSFTEASASLLNK